MLQRNAKNAKFSFVCGAGSAHDAMQRKADPRWNRVAAWGGRQAEPPAPPDHRAVFRVGIACTCREPRMHVELDRPAINLDRNEIAAFENARGARILCTFGALWITLDDDRRDIVLETGESFDVDRDGRVLVMATQPSSLVVLQPAGLAKAA
jgi:hypothetical protein